MAGQEGDLQEIRLALLRRLVHSPRRPHSLHTSTSRPFHSVDKDDNELIVLEQIHLFVEVLDRYFGNVCELDIIFNFHKAYYILDEMFIGGHLQETSKAEVLRICAAMDEMMDESKEEGTTPGRPGASNKSVASKA